MFILCQVVCKTDTEIISINFKKLHWSGGIDVFIIWIK